LFTFLAQPTPTFVRPERFVTPFPFCASILLSHVVASRYNHRAFFDFSQGPGQVAACRVVSTFSNEPNTASANVRIPRMNDRRENQDGLTSQPADTASTRLSDGLPGKPGPALDGANVAVPSGNAFVRFFASHPTGFWFFFWGELAERSCYYGMRAILFLYVANELDFKEDNASTIVSLFIAACYLLPLLGGFLADNLFGKYWTIVGFSLPYIVGQLLLSIDSQQVFGISPRYFLFVSLGLLAMGSGVIKPNISTLMGLTYDQYRPGQTQLRSDAFSFFYMAINIGAFASSVAVPWLRTNYGYSTAFLFPAGLMVAALTLFALGKPFYAREVVTHVVKDPAEKGQQWAVLGKLFGVFLVITFFWMIFDQSTTTWIRFARDDFDLQLFGFHVDPDQVQSLNPLFIVALLPFISVGLWRILARYGIHMRATDKMLVGFGLTAAGMAIMAIAGFLAGPDHKVSLWWQVVTFLLITVAELCISPVGLELAFTGAPPSMKGFVTGCFLLTVFFGNVLNSFLTRLYGPLGPGKYFGLLTLILLVVTVAFIFVASQFNRATEERAALPAGADEKFAPQPAPTEKITERDQYQNPA
jgi:POT family proton-dependent oligopeptide transporter